MLSKTEIEVKDNILVTLRNSEYSLMGYCKAAEQVIETLRMSSGLWQSLGYSYKATEICEEIVRVLSEFKQVREGHRHYASVIKVEKIRMRAHKLSDAFRTMQNERLYAPSN